MNFKDLVNNRKHVIIIAISLIIILTYISLRFILTGSDPITQFIYKLTSPYQLLAEKLANLILHWNGSSLYFQKHAIIREGLSVEGFSAQIMYKKYTLFYILIVWLTNSVRWKNILFTCLYLMANLTASSLYNVAGACSITGQNSHEEIITITHSIVYFSMNTLLLFWYLIIRRSIHNDSGNISNLTQLAHKKLPDIIALIYVYSILLFLISHFDFNLLVGIILKSSQKILALLGYGALAEHDLLIGSNGSISLAKPCLGIMTMFVFTALLYLTSKHHEKVWVYIIFGLLLLNVANIVRIVLLFIYIQKHGTDLAIDIHDLYNYVTYSIVFILWVIWFEKFMHIRSKKMAKPSNVNQEITTDHT